MTGDEEAGFRRGLEIDVLARTIWGEARGEGSAGMQAVACVVLNRAAVSRQKRKYWWGNNIVQICQKPFQFSCWNKNDPNFERVISADRTDRIFVLALEIAALALDGRIHDFTGGATHYHTKRILPYWARGKKPSAAIGNHIFYRIIEN